MDQGARACRNARDENERKKLWAARKGAFGAIGRISPDSMIQDAVVPRSRLPQVLDAAYRIAAKYQLRIANVFHAGDGNLHPLICFDSRFPEQVQRVKDAGRDLMETCVRAGGSITGEHGVGLDKRELLPLIFSEKDMETMLLVRAAFDSSGLMNPGKIIPLLRGCGEARAVAGLGPEDSASSSSLGPRIYRPPASPSSTPKNLTLSGKRFDPPAARDRLVELVGKENVIASPDLPLLSVTPGTIAAVCEVMKLACSEGWTTRPAGAMTALPTSRLNETNLIVSTRRLNRIIEHEPADLVAVTEAGVTLKDFNAHLSINRQWLPIDPPDDGTATIGGVVATGLAGAQQFGYGPPRRHVIGMKVVMADGSLVKAGARVVKNVAGYDLCKLFTGSQGTLGIIVEVNFKLRPLPFVMRTLLVTGGLEELISAGQRIIQRPLFPVAVELISANLLSQLTDTTHGKNTFLMVRFAGSAAAVSAQITCTRELMAVEKNFIQFIEADEGIWAALQALPFRYSSRFMWRVGLRPSEVSSFLLDLIKNTGNEAMWHAGLGDGRIRVIDDSDVNDGGLDIDIKQLRGKAEARGGALITETGEISMDPTLFSKSSTARIMNKIKAQLDPYNIFPSL
jgi:FAD/FMN-containing dehydrogenase